MEEKQLKQRQEAIKEITNYIINTTQKNVCDFLNSGKLDVNKNG